MSKTTPFAQLFPPPPPPFQPFMFVKRSHYIAHGALKTNEMLEFDTGRK